MSVLSLRTTPPKDAEGLVTMKDHFSSPQWVDRVRGRLEPRGVAGMDAHLRVGCRDCLAAFDTWQGVAAFAEEERSSTPPADAIRVVKSYLAQRNRLEDRPGPSTTPWAIATFATLVFDSLHASAAGVRAAAAFTRHLVFEAKSLVVDLHVDETSPTGGVLLIGQVADSKDPGRVLENVWLSLVNERGEVSMFPTNEYGEFNCTFTRGRSLKLMVYAKSQVVAIPLDSLFDSTHDTPGPSERKG